MITTVLKSKNKIKIDEPKKYNIIMINDNVTPFEFVIALLTTILNHSDKEAEALTDLIHTNGSAVVGTYYYEIAEQKSVECVHLARKNKFPLQVKLEEEA